MEYTLQDYTECDHFGTVTLQPSLYELPIAEQIKKTLQPLFTILKPLTTNFLLTLELTKKNNIHYHFICKVRDPELDPFIFVDNLRSYNFKSKKHVFGFSEMEPIKDWERSALYITKDVNKTCKKIQQKAWYDYKYMFMKSIVTKKPKTFIEFDEDIIIKPRKCKQTKLFKPEDEQLQIDIMNKLIEDENNNLDKGMDH